MDGKRFTWFEESVHNKKVRQTDSMEIVDEIVSAIGLILGDTDGTN